jgi:hypothetical protein
MAKSGTGVVLEQSKFGQTYCFLAADIVAEKYFVARGFNCCIYRHISLLQLHFLQLLLCK